MICSTFEYAQEEDETALVVDLHHHHGCAVAEQRGKGGQNCLCISWVQSCDTSALLFVRCVFHVNLLNCSYSVPLVTKSEKKANSMVIVFRMDTCLVD